MVGDKWEKYWAVTLNPEKMIFQDCGDSGEKEVLDLLCDVLGWWNGEAEEMNAAVKEVMRYGAELMVLLAEKRGDHSVSKKAVKRGGALQVVPLVIDEIDKIAAFLAYEQVADPYQQVYESLLGEVEFVLTP